MTYSTICMTMTLASLIPELCWNLNYTARAEHFSSTLYLLFLFCFVLWKHSSHVNEAVLELQTLLPISGNEIIGMHYHSQLVGQIS